MNKSYALDKATSTFGPSVRITGVFGLIGLLVGLLAFAFAYGLDHPIAWAVFFALVAIMVALAVWQLSFRASVHEGGISCRNIFSFREWAWNEIELVYYSAIEVRTRFIPLGEFYRLRLHNVFGHGMSLSNHFVRHEELSITILQCTSQRLAEKAVNAFNSGSTVEFGAVALNRADGITLKRWWFFKQRIPWQNLARYEVGASSVSLYLRKGFFSEPTVSAGRVANVHVLKFLLDRIEVAGAAPRGIA
jgi:hypothetical protein